MRFHCPNCSNEELLVGNQKHHLCPRCRVELLPALTYRDVWMSPLTVLRRMATLSDKFGKERARNDGRFKREREAWTTAIVALAWVKLNRGSWWWVEVETREQTPDTRLHLLDDSAGYNVRVTGCVEVVDWEKNIADVMTVVRQKCQKAYPSDYFLAVHARHAGAVIDFDRIAREMQQIPTPFCEVWVVAAVGERQLKVVCVAPNSIVVDLSLSDDQIPKQPEFVRPGMRGTTPGFYPAGTVFLPVPPDEG